MVAWQIARVLLGIPGGPLLELLLVLGGSGRLVFGLWVFAVEGSRAAVLLEELGGRLIAANFHQAQLVPLPLVEVGRPDKGNVDAEVSVVRRAVET